MSLTTIMAVKSKSTQIHEDLLDIPHFIWLFWEVVGWKTFFSLVNWKVCCILWSWWQQNKLQSAAFNRHHLFGKSPVEFVTWTDADIIICRNIFSEKFDFVSWLLSLIYINHFLMKQITPTNYDSNDSGEIWLRFDEYIKVTTSTHGYTELELLAELGGYVGLFLGLSVFDLRLVFNKILNIFIPN